jgi:periplasmic protein TonB
MTRMRVALAVFAVAGFVAVLGARTPSQAKPPQEDEFLKGTYAGDTQGLTKPKAMHSVMPKYTADAMRAKIQGRVKVQVVVGTEGKVDRARVLESLDKDLGLDEAAVAAARQWTFEPGTLAGRAVPVAMDLVLEFRLH